MPHSEISLTSGTTLNNQELCDIFLCSPQGGMRRAHKTNTLVIVSNHIVSIYDDRWNDNVFHYTGMGTIGDQSLTFAQNKTLSESKDNGVAIHLFEVFVDLEYTYIGQVKLSASPYFEKQPDADNNLRNACVFPLALVDGVAPAIPNEIEHKPFDAKSKKAQRLSDEQIAKKAQDAKVSKGSRDVLSKQYHRDPWIAENAKRLAKGICQLCELPAPFLNKNKKPYLEAHHIVWLANGGEDTIKNTVALCPNCHTKMHIVNSSSDVEKLTLIAAKFPD